MKKILIALAVIATVSFVGCKPSDKKITKNVEKQLDADPTTANVQVSTNEGVVTLSGEVADTAVAKAAVSDATSVKGVKSVVNNLTTPAPTVVKADSTNTVAGKDSTKTVAKEEHKGKETHTEKKEEHSIK